jgi:hypothetical protein
MTWIAPNQSDFVLNPAKKNFEAPEKRKLIVFDFVFVLDNLLT